MKKLYDEGLMNVDAFVTTYSEVNALFDEDKVGYWESWSVLPGDLAEDWIVVNGFTTEEYSPNRTQVVGGNIGSSYNLAANADTEYPEEIAKFVDYLFTEEGAFSATLGYEGVSFDLVEEDGLLKNNLGDYAAAYGYESNEEFRAYKAVACGAFDLYSTLRKGSLGALLDEASREDLFNTYLDLGGQDVLRTIALKEEGLQILDAYPKVKYTAEEMEERGILYTDIYNYLVSAKTQFITGQMDIDSGWDAYIAELEKMGLDRLMEIEQTAYTRFYANK